MTNANQPTDRTQQQQPITLVSLRDRASLAPVDAAVFLGVGYSTLKKWRSEGRGPNYAKVGGSVLYRPADLDVFVEAQLVGKKK